MKSKTLDMNEALLQFINESVTCFHAIEQVKQQLLAQGYIQVQERENGQIKPGGKYFVIRNDASLIAFNLPKESIKGFHIVASHSDSPCFKLKETPEITVEETYRKLNVEKYGGMILSTWLDRPLGVAGRVVIKEHNQFVTRLVDLGKNFCVIPNVAIHFNRDMNKGWEYNPQVDMQALFSGETSADIRKIIAKQLQVEPEEILGSDLFLYNGEKGCRIGKDEEFLLAPRLDDLQCVYVALQGFLAAEPEKYVAVYTVFDNEEVGSRTRQGADSDFLSETLREIAGAYQKEECFRKLEAESFLISADNAHALHPNHPEKSDISNKPYLNQGIVLKFHGNAHYTTDACSAAVIRDLCRRANLPLQTFANRADIAGGSTLGNISISQISIPTADVGLPQLAMHSAMETAGTKDAEDMKQMIALFMSE